MKLSPFMVVAVHKISIPVIPELNVDVINNLILKNAENFNKQMN